ncbi:MAG: helix-turn-helix domain-containing protein [Planctomycetota bacterium]
MPNYIKGSFTPNNTESVAQEFFRPHEVAQKLGISRSLVLRHLRNKNIPGFKFGKAWLIRASELERYLSMKEKLFHDVED